MGSQTSSQAIEADSEPSGSHLTGDFAPRRKLALFFNNSVSAIKRWERECGFPQPEFRVPDTATGEPYTEVRKVFAWIAQQRSSQKMKRPLSNQVCEAQK